MTYDQLVRTSRDPAFACDSQCKIIAWNSAAEDLLGLDSRQAVGKFFHDLLPARDFYGNRFCSCVVNPLTSRGEVVRHQVIFVPTASKVWLKVSLCTMVLTTSKGGLQVLFLRPMEWRESNGAASGEVSSNFRDADGVHEPGPGSNGNGANGHAVAAAPTTLERATMSRWRLTSREVDVLRSMMDGKTAKETAQLLGVSPETVRNHIRNLLRKLKVHSKLEAVALVLGRNASTRGPAPAEPRLLAVAGLGGRQAASAATDR